MLALLPSWVDPTAHYIIHEGLMNTLKIAAVRSSAACSIGVVLGILLTIDFLPTRALIRLYIEVWRGLPIIVTLFLIFFVAPSLSSRLTF